MGNLKMNFVDKDGNEIQAKKLDPNDPEIKAMIARTIKAQEEILRLKYVSRESLMKEITI